MHRLDMHGLRLSALAIVLAFAMSQSLAVPPKTCSPTDAQAADAIVDRIDSWAKLNWAFKKYGHCDDGSIAEGNSEVVARLLVDRWDTLPSLVKLVERNPALEQFVLRHIDSTLDTDDLDKIRDSASSKCPGNAAFLCNELQSAALRAAK